VSAVTLTEEHQNAVELAAATRRLMLAAATTAVGVDEVRAAVLTMDRLREQLAAQTRERALRAPFEGPALAREQGPQHAWTVFATNPQAFPLEIHFDGDTATARTTANALYEGPPGTVHGGYLSHLLDVLLGTLVQATGRRGLTANLDLRYLAPTPLDEPLHLHGRIVDAAGRRVLAEGRVEHAGEVTVEARGTFVDVSRRPADGASREQGKHR
jgi:acyl-coenzyme A thioesterase PaaI-like protein